MKHTVQGSKRLSRGMWETFMLLILVLFLGGAVFIPMLGNYLGSTQDGKMGLGLLFCLTMLIPFSIWGQAALNQTSE